MRTAAIAAGLVLYLWTVAPRPRIIMRTDPTIPEIIYIGDDPVHPSAAIRCPHGWTLRLEDFKCYSPYASQPEWMREIGRLQQ